MIRLEHVTKQFGKFTAASDIILHVKAGEVFAFLGPNGSGKTTTLKAIAGLNIPTSGRILVNGLDAAREPNVAKHAISYLPQHVVFPANLTAAEVIRFYSRLRNLPQENVRRTLKRFDGFEEKLVGEYSGGMRQRLGLAVVTMFDAPILLLDEPTANLDPEGVKRFREFILEQKEQQKTIIFSTHLLAEAEQLADRVGVFVGGRLIAEKSVDNLRREFQASGSSIEDLYLRYVEGDTK